VVDQTVHPHDVGVIFEHERGLHDSAVLDVPSREAVGVQALDDRRGDEVPVGQHHHPGKLASLRCQITQGEIDPFEDELVVLVVAVDEHDLLHAVPVELPDERAADADHGIGVESEGADDVVAAARPLLGLVAEADSGTHETPDLLGGQLGHRG